MATESLMVSESVDPLQSLFGPSLFPRTIVRAPTDPAMPSDPKDLDSVHHLMKSVALSSPEMLLDAGKAIVDRGPELLNSEFEKFAKSIGIDKEALRPRGNEKPQERRPGLGRPRPRFSLKPNTNKPPVTLEPSWDIDRLQDPEEFFSAFEKAENAKREIQRQEGGIMDDSDKYDSSTRNRPRRPGILGKSVSYKHRYSSVLLESGDKPISSQGTGGLDLLGAPSNVADTETQETDVAVSTGSITMTENRVNGILDELISRTSQDLDADEALSLLQERFKIKPIDLDKTCVPVFQDIGRTDFMALGEKVPNVRKTLSNISNLVKPLNGETTVNCEKAAEISISSVASPTPPKSPFASISLLKKRSTYSNSLRDPFSPFSVDLLERRNPAGSQTDLADKGSGSALLESSSECNTSRGAETLLENSNQHNTSRGAESNDSADGTDKQIEKDGDKYESAGRSVKTNSHGHDSTPAGIDAGLHMHASVEVEGIRSEAAIPARPDANMDKSPVMLNMHGSQPLSDQLNTAAIEDNTVVIPSTTAEINAKKNSENLPAKEQGRTKRPWREIHELKALARRKSIQEAGTSFESGVRRSKRIKTRPLEYWKGERFLYGRVNESVKLIGLKYISPAKGDGQLKVKSYVPNEILEVAARL
ncbi:centromere protein C-like [Coffea arabica]|uniref:Centromere protein C-like n=1 Tax=Coffea arabica TaxID=13443 RepID=A0A6P6X2L5_COFAR|nr:centromere protein C-like [Coffea arabica]